MFFDPLYVFLPMPAFALAFWGARRCRRRTEPWAHGASIQGFELASQLLSRGGLVDVSVVSIDGTLTDRYDPSRTEVRLSTLAYEGSDLEAFAIAAHEAGQAFLERRRRLLGSLRSTFYQIAVHGSSLFWLMLIASVVLTNTPFFLVASAILTANVALQGLGLALEYAGDRAVLPPLREIAELEPDRRATVEKRLASLSLRSLAATIDGSYREIAVPAFQRVFK